MKRTRKPVHPGRIFKQDVLQPLGLTVTDAARALGVSRKHLSGFVNERVPCNKDLAARIAKATETGIASWLTMQVKLDTWEAERHQDREVKQIKPFADSAAP